MDLTNEDIIRGLKEGDRKIFHLIFHKYYPMLVFEARGYLINSHDLAEEIVCDIFTRIWLNRENLNIKTSIREYLVKSVHNNCIDYYRQLKRQEKYIEAENAETFHSLLDLGESPLDYILTKELEEKINSVIEELPPQYKKCFKLSRYQDLTYEEIARKMKISVNSVKTNIKNALAIIRKELLSFLIAIVALFYL